MNQNATSQSPSHLPAAQAVAGGSSHIPQPIDTMTGTALVGGLSQPFAFFTHEFAEELGCLDAPGKILAGSCFQWNGKVQTRVEWR